MSFLANITFAISKVLNEVMLKGSVLIAMHFLLYLQLRRKAKLNNVCTNVKKQREFCAINIRVYYLYALKGTGIRKLLKLKTYLRFSQY